MAIDVDQLYNKVSSMKLTKDEILEIIDTLDNATSFGNSKISILDLYLKISDYDNITDELIKKMYESEVKQYITDNKKTSLLLDRGSKQLFDSIWGDNNKYGKWINLFMSEHADSKQLQIFYDDLIKSNNMGASKKWLENIKLLFLSHKNCPEKIQNRNLKNRESLESIAQIPLPSKKALDAIKNWIYYPEKTQNDKIFVNFLKYSKLPWLEIAKIAELTTHLNSKFGKGITGVSEARITAIFNFCKKDDTPESIKLFLFEHTKDDSFLSKSAKEIFIF